MMKDPYTGEQLRFYRQMPRHLRPSFLGVRKLRTRITVTQVLVVAVLLAIPAGYLLGRYIT